MLLKAILKALLIWMGFILVSSIVGGTVIYGVTIISNFIVAHDLAMVILVPVSCAILYIFGLHVNHIYKGMIKCVNK